MSETLHIDRLGRQGDGVAMLGETIAHVPFALAGETITVTSTGQRLKLVKVLEASPERQAPICRHFGHCGGCRLQHFEDGAYRIWKRNLVVEALARAGIETAVEAMLCLPVASRRRAVFSAVRTASGPKSHIVFGFQERDSNRIIDLAECPVLVPAIGERLDVLKALCNALAPARGVMKLTVLACDNGLDLAAECAGKIADNSVDRAIALAGEAGLARLALNGEVVAQFRPPRLSCGSAAIIPPPGGFVQAAGAAEEAMARLVTGHLADCRRTADLFAGSGAFALRLAASSQVHAVEAHGAALEALDRAWRETGGALKRITTEKRDLYRRPLTAGELDGFDGAVFDPPRAGAEAQAGELAKSRVGRIAAVSCNAVTLARDLSLLVDAGYRVVSVTPIDQFVFTPHVEAVALLQR